MKLYGGKLYVKQLIKFLEASYKNNPPEHIDGYDLDKLLSTEFVKVYYNASNKRAIVAHRGSSTLDDAITDVKMTFGFKGNKRHQISKDIQRKSNAKYGDSNITVIGHSLGATLAEDNLKPSNKEGIVVSKPVLPKDILTRRKKPLNQFEIRSQYDPTSILKGLQPDQSDIIVPALTYDPIIEHNYKAVLERLPMNKLIGRGNNISSKDIINTKMNVSQMKAYIKENRPALKGYEIAGKNKAQLIDIVDKINKNKQDATSNLASGKYDKIKQRTKETSYKVNRLGSYVLSRAKQVRKIIDAINVNYRRLDIDNEKHKQHKVKVNEMLQEVDKNLSQLFTEYGRINKISKKVDKHNEALLDIDNFLNSVTNDLHSLKKSNKSISNMLSNYDNIVKLVNKNTSYIDNMKETYPEVIRDQIDLSKRFDYIERNMKEVIQTYPGLSSWVDQLNYRIGKLEDAQKDNEAYNKNSFKQLESKYKEIKKFVGASSKAARMMF